MGACDDIQVDLGPADFDVAITGPKLTVEVSSKDFNVTTSPPSYCDVSIISSNIVLELGSINFAITLDHAPPASPDIDLGAADFDIAISPGPPYDVDIIQAGVILSNTAVAAGPEGPPGPPGPTGEDSTVPGPSGPQGPAGPAGNAAWTTTTTSFTIPAIGFTGTVNVVDASWVAVGEMVYLSGAGGPTLAGAMQVIAKTGNQLTLLTPSPPAGGSSSGTLQMVWGETPAGSIDGTNKIYTTLNSYQANLLAVFLNGLRQQRTSDYTETGSNSFQFVNAPLSGDSLSIDYTMT